MASHLLTRKTPISSGDKLPPGPKVPATGAGVGAPDSSDSKLTSGDVIARYWRDWCDPLGHNGTERSTQMEGL